MNRASTTVLFLSTGDAARGLLAEGLLKNRGGFRFSAFSAGYRILPKADPRALEMLEENGISAAGLYPKNIQEFFDSPRALLVDVIVTLSEEARALYSPWPGDPIRVHWPVDDPLAAADISERDSKFRKCFMTLQNRVDALIKQRVPQSPVDLMFQLRSIAAVV